MNTKSINRREFCQKSSFSLLALSSIAMAAPQKNQAISITLDLSLPANNVLNQIGGSKYVAFGNDPTALIVVRTSATTAATYSAVCTHQGCTIDLPQNNISSCPCHGSSYDTSGNVVSGPATENLQTYPTSISGNKIFIGDASSSIRKIPSAQIGKLSVNYDITKKILHFGFPLKIKLYKILVFDISGKNIGIISKFSGNSQHYWLPIEIKTGVYTFKAFTNQKPFIGKLAILY